MCGRGVLIGGLALWLCGCLASTDDWPPLDEVCNRIDDDLDGRVDEMACIGLAFSCGNGVVERLMQEDCEPGRPLADGLMCGAAQSPAPCRLLCESNRESGKANCPRGWVCAPAGFCEKPATYFQSPILVEGVAWPLAAGDLDGDGYVDLASTQSPVGAIAFGSPSGDYSATVPFPAGDGTLQPLLLGGDALGRDRLFLVGDDELQAYGVRSGRWVEPYAQATHVWQDMLWEAVPEASTLMVPSGLPGEDDIGVVVEGTLFGFKVYLPRDGLPGSVTYVPYRAGGELPGHIAVGDFVSNEPRDATSEFAFGVVGENIVWLMEVRCTSQTLGTRTGDVDCAIGRVGHILLPVGWSLAGPGTFAGDLYGDGVDGVVIAVQSRDVRALAYARRDPATGRLAPAEIHSVPASAADSEIMQSSAPDAWLVAVGELDVPERVDDERDEVVLANGILRSRLTVGDSLAFDYEPLPSLSGQLFAAAVSDLNRDRVPDLAGLTASGLDVWLGRPDGGVVFRPQHAATANRLSIGDFDGDLLPDALLTNGERVFVSFNEDRGSFQEPSEVFWASGDYLAASVGSLDNGLSGVFAVSYHEGRAANEAVKGEWLSFLLRGSPSRRLTTRRRMPEAIELSLQSPEGALGLLIEDLADPARYRLLMTDDVDVSFYGGLTVDLPGWTVEDGCRFVPGERPVVSRPHTVFDDQGQVSEVVVGAIVPEDGVDSPATPRVLRFNVAASRVDCLQLQPSAHSHPPSDVALGDINGDGLLDVIVSYGDRTTREYTQANGLVVLWEGQTDGRFAQPIVPRLGRQAIGPIAVIPMWFESGAIVALVTQGYEVYVFSRSRGEYMTAVQGGGFDPFDVERLIVADVDGNGTSDLIAPGRYDTAVLVQPACPGLEESGFRCSRLIP